MESEGRSKSEFHFHAAGESFALAVERKFKLFDERLLERAIPSGIELAKVFQQVSDFRPFRDFDWQQQHANPRGFREGRHRRGR
jgi:hypothetical protein